MTYNKYKYFILLVFFKLLLFIFHCETYLYHCTFYHLWEISRYFILKAFFLWHSIIVSFCSFIFFKKSLHSKFNNELHFTRNLYWNEIKRKIKYLFRTWLQKKQCINSKALLKYFCFFNFYLHILNEYAFSNF